MEKTLTEIEAYNAAFQFLKMQYEIAKDTIMISDLLSYMSLLPEGVSADPAMLEDWKQAVQDTRDGKVDIAFRLLPKDR